MLNISTIVITPYMLGLISEIDEFKGAWRALDNLAPDRLSALRHVATIESTGSSTRIEGSGSRSSGQHSEIRPRVTAPATLRLSLSVHMMVVGLSHQAE
jgi:hypothetical protein